MRTSVNILQHKWVQILIILVGIGLIVSLSRDILRLLRSADELKLAAQKVEELQKESESLAQKKGYYQSESFIEEEARNKLNMAKEGETVVILPPNLKEVIGRKENQLTKPLPNWHQWLNLFL
jgi:cell division protein FtsB